MGFIVIMLLYSMFSFHAVLKLAHECLRLLHEPYIYVLHYLDKRDFVAGIF